MLNCQKCGHEWESRVSSPKTCSKCRCRKWNNYSKLSKPVKASEEGILNSETSGELILLMSFLTAPANKLAFYLGKSEPAIGMTLHNLEAIGLVIVNSKGIRELDKVKLNEICQKLAIELCKKQSESEIQKVRLFKQRKRNKISDMHLTLLGDMNYLTAKAKKNKIFRELRKRDVSRLSEMRDKFVLYLEERKKKEIEKIEQLFSEQKFNDFLVGYLHLFFPSIKRKLSDLVQYYIKYGDLKVQDLYEDIEK